MSDWNKVTSIAYDKEDSVIFQSCIHSNVLKWLKSNLSCIDAYMGQAAQRHG